MSKEEAISNLKRYIEEDLIYKENKPKSDFDEFCINHCRDIEIVLNYITKLENKLKEKDNIISKLNLESQKYFNMLMEVEYGRDKIPKQVIRDKIKELHYKSNKTIK